MKINEIMKPYFHTISLTNSINKVLNLMNSLNINNIPVVDDNDVLVGMIVKSDIYNFMIHPGHYSSCPVEWGMSKSLITAQSNDDLITVAKRLRKNNIIAMPVIKDKKVIGIISIEDLLDYFLTEG